LARYLALDWDHQFLHLVSANIGRGSAQVLRAASWHLEQSPNPAEVEELGSLLRQRLQEAGIAPAPVLVSVGRDRLILKDVRYPQVPAGEEPAIVRFQASKELTYPADEVVIDYTPAAGPGSNGERRALALIVRRELLQMYQSLCRAAGLKLAGITPRPFGIAAAVQRTAGALPLTDPLAPTPFPQGDAAVAVLTVTAGWAEFCVVQGGGLMFTRSLAPGAGLVGEIRRNLALYAGQPNAASARVQALYVAGNGEHNLLREQLQELLAIPVHPLDPFAGIEHLEVTGHRGGFAGAAGLVYAQAGAGLPINFIQPKEPKPPRDPKRVRYAMAAGLGLLVLVLGVLFCGQVLADRTREIQKLTGEISDLESDLGRLGKDAEDLQQVEGATDGAISWLEILADVSARFGDTKVMHLTELAGRPTTNTAAGKKYVAQVTLNGELAEEKHEVDRLADRQAQKSMTSRYRIADKKISPPADEKAPWKFTIQVDIEKLVPDKKTTTPGGNRAGNGAAGRQP
jgi:Tfp pilus assembly PilM family ATPase